MALKIESSPANATIPQGFKKTGIDRQRMAVKIESFPYDAPRNKSSLNGKEFLKSGTFKIISLTHFST